MTDSTQPVREVIASLGFVDWVALSVLFLFLLRGLVQGFVWQVATLAGVVGGLLAARSLAPQVAPKVREWFSALDTDDGLDMVVAYFGVFVAVLLAVALLGSLLREMIDKLHLHSFDRLLGGLLGLVKAATLVVVAVSFLSLFGAFQKALANSHTARISGIAVTRGGPFFPQEVKDHIQSAFEDIEERFAEAEEPPDAPPSSVVFEEEAAGEMVSDTPDPVEESVEAETGPDPAHSGQEDEGASTVSEPADSAIVPEPADPGQGAASVPEPAEFDEWNPGPRPCRLRLTARARFTTGVRAPVV